MKKLNETDYLVNYDLPNGFASDRYNGGWAKIVTGLDKSKESGYSIKGDFLDGGKEFIYRVSEGKLYLDCDIQGSRKNQTNEYTLFTVEKGEIKILHKYSNYCNSNRVWAVDFWPFIEEHLTRQPIKSSQNVKMMQNKTILSDVSTDIIIKELTIRGYDTTTLASHIVKREVAKTQFRAIELDETL